MLENASLSERMQNFLLAYSDLNESTTPLSYNSTIDNSHLWSFLEHGYRPHINDTIEDFAKVLENWRNKYNITVRKEQECSTEYCGGGVHDVVTAYNGIHGYVSLLVCVFGSLANALNVAVLTRRDMATAPINRLLKWLAVADVFVMLEYVPFATYKYFILPGQMDFPYSWAVYLLFHMHFTQILHTASICLTLSLAVWRYLAIKYPARSASLCTERRCSVAILASFALPPLLCIPAYMVFIIHKQIIRENDTSLVFYHVDSDYEGTLYQLNFWVHAVIIKLLPCFILTVISAWLIRALYSANSRKKALKSYNYYPASTVVNGNGTILANTLAKRQSKSDRRTDRTTKMLVAVLLLFLLTEFPQGILGLMSGLLGRCFFKECYGLFGELMDILALLNGAINFILYCSMSRQFRLNFGSLIRGAGCYPHTMGNIRGSHTEVHTTYV